MLKNRIPETYPEKNPSHSTMYNSPTPMACFVTRPSQTNIEA